MVNIILIVIVAIVLFIIWLYNKLVRFRNRVKEGWADIETQLKRRYDLIPNLVNTVKGYAKHEKGVFERVTEMRANTVNSKGAPQRAESENMLTGALKSLFAVSENYPDLKANQNFIELQKELTDTENKIQAARRFYNNVVLDYNNSVETIPSNIIASAFNFSKKDFFELEETEKEQVSKPVEVKI